MNSVLVIAAHADDEALGCGGALARHAASGAKVRCVFLADGASARGATGDADRRNQEASAAAEVLGIDPPILLGFPDNQMDSLPLLKIVQAVEKTISEIQPQIVYTHHGGDLNVDHRIAHQAVLTACRPQPGACVKAIYGFETQSSTEWASPETSPGFRPTRFIDISEQLDKKLAALKCYDNEMRPFPHTRSYEAVASLARLRGAAVGLEAAEAFSVLREIVS